MRKAMLRQWFLFILGLVSLPLAGFAATTTTTAPANGIYVVDGTTYPRTSAGIQSIVDAVPAGGSAIIILTNGDYQISKTVTCIDKGITFKGESAMPSASGAYLEKSASFVSGPMFQITQTDKYGFNSKNSNHFENLYLCGNYKPGDGIGINGFLHGSITNCVIRGFSGAGISLDTGAGSPVSNAVVDHCYIYGNYKNIQILDTNDQYVSALHINDCWITSPINDDGNDIFINAGTKVCTLNLNSCYLETVISATAQNGILATGNAWVDAANTYFDIYGTNKAFDFTGVTSNNKSAFIGCTIIGNYVDSPVNPSTIENSYSGALSVSSGSFINGKSKVGLASDNGPALNVTSNYGGKDLINMQSGTVTVFSVTNLGSNSKLKMNSPDGKTWSCQPASKTGVFTCS